MQTTFLKTRNAWQSLAYSPHGIVVSPLCEYLWNTPNYWSPQCLTAPPLANIVELTVGKLSTEAVQLLTS